MKIHSTAIIAPDAQIEEGVEIGPYAVIGSDVKIGKNTMIGPHTVIDDYTHIGESCRIFQFCSIGATPQDLKFGGEKIACYYRQCQHDSRVCRRFTAEPPRTSAMTFIGNQEPD